MADNKRYLQFDLPTNEPDRVIEVKVRYYRFDGSYVNDRADAQGYWLHVTPVKLEGAFRVSNASEGYKKLLEPAKRFGAKKLDTVFTGVRHEILTGHTDDRLVEMVLRVAAEKGLRITQWDKASKE